MYMYCTDGCELFVQPLRLIGYIHVQTHFQTSPMAEKLTLGHSYLYLDLNICGIAIKSTRSFMRFPIWTQILYHLTHSALWTLRLISYTNYIGKFIFTFRVVFIFYPNFPIFIFFPNIFSFKRRKPGSESSTKRVSRV